MSFSAHKRNALDVTVPIQHRMSALRSCAMLMGQKYDVRRRVIIELVLQRSAVDIRTTAKELEILRAVEALMQIKESGIE